MNKQYVECTVACIVSPQMGAYLGMVGSYRALLVSPKNKYFFLSSYRNRFLWIDAIRWGIIIPIGFFTALVALSIEQSIHYLAK